MSLILSAPYSQESIVSSIVAFDWASDGRSAVGYLNIGCRCKKDTTFRFFTGGWNRQGPSMAASDEKSSGQHSSFGCGGSMVVR
jgi:hypothetical protein